MSEKYSEPCQSSKMERFVEIVTAKSRQLILQNASS